MDGGRVEQIDDLELTLMIYEQRSKELNIKLMRTMAELSDAQDTLKRWRAELEIVASKSDHNGCHIWIPDLLKRTLGHTGNFLDPENMTPEQFAEGCIVYHGDRFGNCGVKLVVIKEGEQA